LSLKFLHTAKPPGYWNDFSNVERELLEFAKTNGNKMPTYRNLHKAGRSDLATGIRKQGGVLKVANRLNLKLEGRKTKTQGYWKNLSNVKRELRRFIEVYGVPGTMPSYSELKKAGRLDLARAISKHGGYLLLAEQLGLKFSYAMKPSGYWSNFSNVGRELLDY